MANFTFSPNMSLRQINEKVKFWYVDWLVNFNLIDSHNHASGKGVQIPEGGILNAAVTAVKIAASAGSNGQFLRYGVGGALSWASPTGSGTVNSGVAGRLALFPSTDTIVDDAYTQNAKEIYILIANHSSLAANRTYTITEIGEDADFVMTKGTQTIAGTKTYTSPHLDTPVLDGGSGSLPPLGTIFAHYGYDGANVIAIDTDYFRYCDGTAGVVFGDGKTRDLPDLSNRYLVGLGTEGGGDIDTAAWSITPVGNANHQVTLTAAQSGLVQHSHTASFSGSRTMSEYNYDSTNHAHQVGWNNVDSGGGGNTAVAEVVPRLPAGYIVSQNSGDLQHRHYFTPSGSVTVNDVASASAVSAHSIQCRSIPVRWIIRIK